MNATKQFVRPPSRKGTVATHKVIDGYSGGRTFSPMKLYIRISTDGCLRGMGVTSTCEKVRTSNLSFHEALTSLRSGVYSLDLDNGI